MRLTSLEYAVLYDLNNPNPPEGFSGNDALWKHDTNAGLWECHTWN